MFSTWGDCEVSLASVPIPPVCCPALQIALFAIPLAVIVAWLQNIPFSLSFDSFSALCLTLSVLHVNNVTNDASSHWLLGVQLIAVYAIIALTFLFRD